MLNLSYIKRREFLKKTFGILASSYFLGSCSTKSGDYLFISASHAEGAGWSIMKQRLKDPYLAVYDSRTDKTEVYPAPSLTHSIVQNPRNPFQFLCMPQVGETAFLYDHEEKSLKSIEADKEMMFYGHGAFHPDGNSFYTAQAKSGKNVDNEIRALYEGIVVLQDLKTLDKKNELFSFGNDPHDLVSFQDNKVLIANSGADTSVTQVDLDNGKLISKHPCEIDGILCRHIALDNNGDMYVMTVAQNRGDHCQLLYPENGILIPFKYDEKYEDYFETQLLSHAVTPEYIITTSPMRNALHIWDKHKKVLLEVRTLDQPSAVAKSLDGKSYIVTSHNERSALEYDVKDNSLIREIEKLKKLTGKHSLLAEI